MDYADLVHALNCLPIGQIKLLPKTGSTNSDAAAWADTGAPDLSIILAEEQTAGRGRSGRQWFTLPGSALAFSLILTGNPVVDTQAFNRLTALGTLAVCTALEGESGVEPRIKWPNDVLIAGRKVAGVLTELYWEGDRLKWAILGIGVNVGRSSVPPESLLLFPAVSLEEVYGHPIDRLRLLRSILEQILAWRPHLALPEFLEAWENRLAYRGEWVQVLDNGLFKKLGRLEGLNPDGSLQLRDQTGNLINIYAGDLTLRPMSPNSLENKSQT